MPFRLKPVETVADGLRRVVTEQLSGAVADLSDDQMPPTEQVHQFRKRCKKLRAVLELMEPGSPSGFSDQKRAMKQAAQSLNVLRDAQVAQNTLEELEASSPNGIRADPSLGGTQNELLDTCTRRMVDILDDVHSWEFPKSGRRVIVRGYAETYRHGRRAWKRARATPTVENYHRLRKWTKYHWYQVRLIQDLNRHQLGRRRQWLQRLGQVLGDAHDLALLQEHPDVSDALQAQLKSRQERLESEARILAARTFRRSTKKTRRQLRQWWKHWPN